METVKSFPSLFKKRDVKAPPTTDLFPIYETRFRSSATACRLLASYPGDSPEGGSTMPLVMSRAGSCLLSSTTVQSGTADRH